MSQLTAARRWHKAVMVSLALHILILLGAGWLTGKVLVHKAMPEEYLELELALDSETGEAGELQEAGGGGAAADSQAADSPPATASPGMPKQYAQAAVVIPDSMLSPAVADEGTPAAGAEGGDGSAQTGLLQGGVNGGNGGNDGSGTAGSGTASGRGNGNPGGNGSGLIAPGVVAQVKPVYPEEAKRAGQQGTVILTIQILQNGLPGRISVQQSCGYSGLDAAAVAAVRQWRFSPAKERGTGRAVTCHTTLPVVFRLEK